jgi:hypothetical protein
MMRGLLMGLVRGYRLLLSPWLGSSCRFEPTCSAYSLQALDRYGAAAGSYLTVRRLARCHPWCQGGLDPVPQELPRGMRLFSRLVPHDTPSSSPTEHS